MTRRPFFAALVLGLFLIGCQSENPSKDADAGPIKVGIVGLKYTYNLSNVSTPLNQDVILFFERLTDQLTLRLDHALPAIDWVDIEEFYRLPEYEALPASRNPQQQFSPFPYTYSDFVESPKTIADFCEQTQLQYALVISFGTSSSQHNDAQVVAKAQLFNAKGALVFQRDFPLGVFWRQFQATPDINGHQKPDLYYPENRAIYERGFRVFLEKFPKELGL